MKLLVDFTIFILSIFLVVLIFCSFSTIKTQGSLHNAFQRCTHLPFSFLVYQLIYWRFSYATLVP